MPYCVCSRFCFRRLGRTFKPSSLALKIRSHVDRRSAFPVLNLPAFVPTSKDLQACCSLLPIDVHCPRNDSCARQCCVHPFQTPSQGIQAADMVVSCIPVARSNKHHSSPFRNLGSCSCIHHTIKPSGPSSAAYPSLTAEEKLLLTPPLRATLSSSLSPFNDLSTPLQVPSLIPC